MCLLWTRLQSVGRNAQRCRNSFLTSWGTSAPRRSKSSKSSTLRPVHRSSVGSPTNLKISLQPSTASLITRSRRSKSCNTRLPMLCRPYKIPNSIVISHQARSKQTRLPWSFLRRSQASNRRNVDRAWLPRLGDHLQVSVSAPSLPCQHMRCRSHLTKPNSSPSVATVTRWLKRWRLLFMTWWKNRFLQWAVP